MPLTLQCGLMGVAIWGWRFIPTGLYKEPCKTVTTDGSEQGAGAMERARLALGKFSKRRAGKAGEAGAGDGSEGTCRRG